jgi:hypothetical protein
VKYIQAACRLQYLQYAGASTLHVTRALCASDASFFSYDRKKKRMTVKKSTKKSVHA